MGHDDTPLPKVKGVRGKGWNRNVKRREARRRNRKLQKRMKSKIKC